MLGSSVLDGGGRSSRIGALVVALMARAPEGIRMRFQPRTFFYQPAMRVTKLWGKWERKFNATNAIDKLSCELLLQAAEKGNLREFERLYTADEKRLLFQDSRGRAAVHHAAAHDRVNILDFILKHQGDMQMLDNDGNTPLHSACENEAVNAITFLIDNGCDTSILNNSTQSPLHLATQLNKIKSLQELVKHKDKLDTNLRSKHGRTSLHLAAIYDHAECAMILLSQFGASPKLTCDNGYYPIHEAAKNASANAMKALLDWGESIGYSREEMMKLYDADGNVPLHSAVHAGDIKAVKLCLESGALISTQQHDLSTPVHLACAQGAMDIVKLMFSSQPDQKINCLTCSDAQQMTPIHCAAMFDHIELVEYLVTEGANMNATDKEGRSVILLAAARGAWKTVTTLLRLGADLGEKDNLRRNLLQHIVLSGGCLEDFYSEINERMTDFALLLNEKDVYGCTAMHYASRNGQLKTIEGLLHFGAIVNLKNNENQSPLHFAARYGRYNTVRHLLESKKGHLIINEMDGEGKTPLHIASQNGHTRVVHLLLVKGALLHRDHKGRTPLHYAVTNGYTHTMEQLLAVHSHLLDQSDRDGNSALHLAAVYNKANTAALLLSLNCKIARNEQDFSPIDYALHYKHSEVAMAMVTHVTRSEEVMCTPTKGYTCLVEGLTAVMPEVMMAVLDRGITKSKYSHDSTSYYVKHSFQALQNTEEAGDIVPETDQPLPVMNIMVRYGREELLSHPLCVKYLETKWNSYGMYFHMMNLAVYTVFLAFLTTNAVQLMSDKSEKGNSSKVSSDLIMAAFAKPSNDTIISLTSVIVLGFVGVNIMKEFYQMYQQRAKYFLDIMNVLEWTLYISAGIMAAGHLSTTVVDKSNQYIMAALAVFLAWFNYLLYLQRFNRVGLYVVMFLEILSTLLKVMFVFSVLIIAFGLSFHILLAKVEVTVKTPVVDPYTGNITLRSMNMSDKGFHNPVISLVRVGTMMLGELDFLGTYLRPMRMLDSSAWYQIVAATWFLVVFIVLMPILLMNLLIGLAVGDIETVRRNAQLKRLTMQVELHTDLERKLPRRLLTIVDKTEVYVYPNQKGSSSYVWQTLQRWFASPKEQSKSGKALATGGGVSESAITEMSDELSRQKKRMKDISRALEQQLSLLRLIIQKMEIRTENDEVDEGCFENVQDRPISAASAGAFMP
ncbi:transient receptor potential cation channel subfamily A member 1-like isoform X2 [Ornithodoros turicata]|uniref:transient receptor potential cation channel subfamily A member 1-like isoform X2 n=1 Tax=Ornithodoros turicata TaxID=34597 RepID=UPI0031391A7D